MILLCHIKMLQKIGAKHLIGKSLVLIKTRYCRPHAAKRKIVEAGSEVMNRKKEKGHKSRDVRAFVAGELSGRNCERIGSGATRCLLLLSSGQPDRTFKPSYIMQRQAKCQLL